ncbi:unnamed protein product [Ambrosiozyma monospora]|uniref:Unnamed protein product n=1 Tax=Ambrosiozyma monospora TaxID=43982 RepID=A0A9W6YYF1_AMBMO|nr:unnamed protein product [Ambrosiozyma monospora]
MAAANGNGQYDESNQFQSGNGQLKQQQFQQIPNGNGPFSSNQNQRLFAQNFNNQQRQRTASPLSNGNIQQQQQQILTPAPTISSPAQFPMDEDEEMDEEPDVCIDEPAKHLYVIEHTENRPFKCPVIGCEKNYKNQNGLKYHRAHGHQNQTLRENPDGTFSVIDPESDAPYPDGMGMEKDKPYRCEVCGKRYKNLNGLKYHRGHTTH